MTVARPLAKKPKSTADYSGITVHMPKVTHHDEDIVPNLNVTTFPYYRIYEIKYSQWKTNDVTFEQAKGDRNVTHPAVLCVINYWTESIPHRKPYETNY